MAKLYFYFSAMNAGKSTILLQSAYNYHEKGMKTLLFTFSLDNRYGEGLITSRIGLKAAAELFDKNTALFEKTLNCHTPDNPLACVLVDEAQFLTKQQVADLTRIVDELNIPVLAYGLRTDFLGNAFEGSLYLLLWADHLAEIKTICHCGRKAIMNARIDQHQQIVHSGEQVHIGGNDHYVALCRKHFNERLNEPLG